MWLFGRHKETSKQTNRDELVSSDNYVVAARTKEVRSGHIHEAKLGNYKICLTKVGENYYAFDAFCPHQGWMLWAGEMHGENVRCDKHRWVFNVRTGETIAPSDMPVSLPVFPLKIENDHILVDFSAVHALNLKREANNK